MGLLMFNEKLTTVMSECVQEIGKLYYDLNRQYV